MKIKHVNFKVEIKGNGIVTILVSKILWNRESQNGNKTITSANDNITKTL
jgi:hypothetical protein